MRTASRVAILACFVASFCFGQDDDLSKVQIKVSKVAGTVYMLEGAGGNIGVSAGDDGIVLVDDQFGPLVAKIQAALKSISDKPVRFIINTHFHDDHTSGNDAFQKLAPIIAQDNLRKRLETGGKSGNGGSMHFDAKPLPKSALPIITFDREITLHLNGEDIRVLHVPTGHTDGDSVVYFPKSNVVHMGDDFVTYGFPFIDIDAGGSIDGMIAGVESAIAPLPPDVRIIPGHGPVSTLDDVRAYVKMLKDTRATVQGALEKKMRLDQMKERKILDPWKKYGNDFVSEDAFLETIYNSLTSNKSGMVTRHN